MERLEELVEHVRRVVSEITRIPLGEIKGGDRLREDLGLDSVQSMELLSRVSEHFDIDPDVEEALRLQTVAEVAEALGRSLPRKDLSGLP